MADRPITVSIIIPNLNSPIVDRTLNALRRQHFDLATVEVLVVGLDEPGLVQEDGLVRFIKTDGPATAAVARNIGLRAARGELLCLTDADCIPNADWLVNLTAPFIHGDFMAAGGGITFDADGYWTLVDNVSWFYPYLAQRAEGELPLLPSLNMCIRRPVMDDVGLFNERFPKAAGEDSEWTTRMRQAGYTLQFIPAAVVRHRPSRSTFGAAMRHGYIYGRYSVKINPAFTTFLRTPAVLTRWWSVLLLSPLMAAGVTAKAYLTNRSLWKYWYAAPAVALTKLSWCFGLVKSLRSTQLAVDP